MIKPKHMATAIKRQLLLVYVRNPVQVVVTTIAYVSMAIAVVFLLKNQALFYVPNPDVFQYILTGQALLKANLPLTVQEAPLYPLAIQLFSIPFAIFHVQYHELRAAVLISTIASTGTAWLVWKIVKMFVPSTGALIVLWLLLTNPLFYLVSLETTPDALLAFLATLCLYSWFRKKTTVSLIAALLLALTRYEGLVVYCALAGWQGWQWFKQQRTAWGKQGIFIFSKLPYTLLISLFVLVGWLMTTYVISKELAVAYGNKYLEEIVSRRHDLPTWEILGLVPNAIYVTSAYLDDVAISQSILVGGVIALLTTAVIVRHHTFVLGAIIIFSYFGIHLAFPAFDDRYLIPVLPALFIFLSRLLIDMVPGIFVKKSLPKSLFFFPLVLIIFHNVFLITSFLEFYRYYLAEYRLGSEWLQTAELPTDSMVVLSPLALISDYYVERPDLEFFIIDEWIRRRCQSLKCVIDEYDFDPTKLLVLKDNSVKINDTFNILENGILIFTNPEEDRCLDALTTVSIKNRWQTVYRYRSDWCS